MLLAAAPAHFFSRLAGSDVTHPTIPLMFVKMNKFVYPSFSVVPDSVSRHKECGLRGQNHVGW